MAKYTKSHSNYVINEMRQLSNSGTIYERDITTIGGRDSFSRGQIPVYRSGNFVITINGEDKKTAKVGSTNVWVNNNGSNSNIWTLETMGDITDEPQDTHNDVVEPNKNLYNLSDFAYYGSCSELFRSSVNDIIRRFPGELYVPYRYVTEYTRKYQTTSDTDQNGIILKKVRGGYKYLDGTPFTGAESDVKKNQIISGSDVFHTEEEISAAGVVYGQTSFVGADDLEYTATWGEGSGIVGNIAYYDQNTSNPKPIGFIDDGESRPYQLYELSNPLGINLVYDNLDDEYNPLKYFKRNNNYKNYELIDSRGFVYDIDAQFLLGGSFGSGATTSFKIQTADLQTYAVSSQLGINDSILTVEEPSINPHNPRRSRGVLDARPSIFIDNTTIPESGVSEMNYASVISSRTSYDYNEDVIVGACPGDKIGEVRLILTSQYDKLRVEPLENTVSATTTENSGLTEVIESRNEIGFRTSGDTQEGESGWTEWSVATIYIYLGDEGTFHYLVNLSDFEKKDLLGAHIRPKVEFFDDFYGELDTFEQLLINPYTEPLYTSTFNIVEEDDFGDFSHIETFTFPTDSGGYNVATDGMAYSFFISRLSEIGEYYDIRYSDVIWRAMTHEAIKNLDWTLTKRDENDVDETHASAYGRINKTIRTTGRFFDDLLSHIDNLKTTNTITYDKNDNLSDAFIKDKLNECGWDVVQITPFHLIEYQEGTNGDMAFDWFGLGYRETMSSEMNNMIYDSDTNEYFKINRKFFRDNTTKGVYPYFMVNSDNDDWKYENETLQCDSTKRWKTIGRDYILPSGSTLFQRAYKKYGVDKLYTYPEINNEFMRRLTINTRGIVKKKGSVEGIESILGMFGMKSKRFVQSLSSIGYTGDTLPYDYDVKEYVAKVNSCIVDNLQTSNNEYFYDELNQDKEISYDTPEFRNGINVPYIGIPVKYYEDTTNNRRYLYPYFDKNETYDGNPYYQMYGGWQQKLPYTFDVNDNIIAKDVLGDAFSETIKEIVSVPTLKDLMELPYYNLKDNQVVLVDDTSGIYVIVDGVLYDLFTDDSDDNHYLYFPVTVNDSTVAIGNTYFDDTVTVSNPYSKGGKKKYDLRNGSLDGTVIRVYVNTTSGETVIKAYSNVTSVSRVSLFNGAQRASEGYTNYFTIRDAYSAGEISEFGWRQLKKTDKEYYIINNLRNEYDGNNPHNGKLSYDNGTSYVTQFSKLFRYSIDNDMFSERLYEKLGESAEDSLESFGFDLYNNSDDESKDLSFGDCYGTYTLVRGNGLEEGSTKKIGLECDTLKALVDRSGNTQYVHTTAEHDTYDETVDTGALVGEKVINTKFLDIDFMIYVEEINDIENSKNPKIDQQTYLYTNDALKQVKYIEESILPYLNQMIPSNCICRINYKLSKLSA